MKNRLTPIAGILIVLLMAGYVGSYYALIQVGPNFRNSDPNEPFSDVVFVATYRVGGEPVEFAFYPMNWVDRNIRVDTWEVHFDDSDPFTPLLPP